MKVNDPGRFEIVGFYPIVDAFPIIDCKLVVLANFTNLCAYTEHGVIWTTKRIAWDGIKILQADADQ